MNMTGRHSVNAAVAPVAPVATWCLLLLMTGLCAAQVGRDGLQIRDRSPASLAERLKIQPSQAVHYAATRGDLDALLAALEDHPETINEPLPQQHDRSVTGLTPLMLAAWQGWREGIETLLTAGADPALPTLYGYTTVHFVARSRCVECLERLIEAGADPGRASDHEIVPLDWAVRYSDRAMVDGLIGYGAATHAVLLCRLAQNLKHGAAIIESLLEREIAMDATCDPAGSTLNAMIRAGNEKAAVALLAAFPEEAIEATDNDGHSAYLLAARAGMGDLMDRLVSRGASAERVNLHGESAIHFAAMASISRIDLKTFERIVKRTRTVNQRDHRGRTPLMRIQSDENRVAVLVEHGASIDAQDHEGLTALHHALAQADPWLATELIYAGADLDTADHEGRSSMDMIREILAVESVIAELWEPVLDAVQSRQSM